MEALLLEWGTEILFAVISTIVIGFVTWNGNKLKKQKEKAEEDAKILAEQRLTDKITRTVENELTPIYEELEDLRKYIRETATIEKTHMNLIIASYKFRLVQLCKGFLSQGYITIDQRTQLDEFYKLYTGLGGNGQAKIYYEECLHLPPKAHE